MMVYLYACHYRSGYVVVFFFQAEDGIRDYKVTGVQTCALPISRRPAYSPESGWIMPDSSGKKRLMSGRAMSRSEERRVGKGWRCRRGGEDGRRKRVDGGRTAQ